MARNDRQRNRARARGAAMVEGVVAIPFLLLMFASTISAAQAVESLKSSKLVTNPEALAQVANAWPNSELVIDDGGRRLMVVAAAERFSDQAMGISEKVTPDAGQRVLFNQAFGVIDRLFGRVASGGK